MAGLVAFTPSCWLPSKADVCRAGRCLTRLDVASRLKSRHHGTPHPAASVPGPLLPGLRTTSPKERSGWASAVAATLGAKRRRARQRRPCPNHGTKQKRAAPTSRSRQPFKAPEKTDGDQSACLRRKAGISMSSMPAEDMPSTRAAAWVRPVRQTAGIPAPRADGVLSTTEGLSC